jgi:hypothetical protein
MAVLQEWLPSALVKTRCPSRYPIAAALAVFVALFAVGCSGGLPVILTGAQVCVTDVDGSIVVTERALARLDAGATAP